MGESIVIRILDREKVILDLHGLGFPPRELQLFDQLIPKPYGMILVTGPTGSGKTTTLYAALTDQFPGEKDHHHRRPGRIPAVTGSTQMQVKPTIGLTFARGLRSILRQDPDIIMVGEIRDRETAEIAIHAALTGHLVFCTLHTNDAAGAITRLLDMGIEPFPGLGLGDPRDFGPAAGAPHLPGMSAGHPSRLRGGRMAPGPGRDGHGEGTGAFVQRPGVSRLRRDRLSRPHRDL